MTDPTTSRPPARPWLGVLLSLLVPGFGLVRAGRFARGISWFFAIQLVGVLVTLLLIWRVIASWAAVGAIIAAIAVQIVMLVDSYRPGRLNVILLVGFALVLSAIILLPLPVQLVAQAIKIPTAAMEPTLQGVSRGTPDHVIVDCLSYRFSAPQRGDLAIFTTTGIAGIPDNPSFVKRVVGLPGEKIQIRDGHLFADGRQLDEQDGIPPVSYTTAPVQNQSLASGGTYVVPESAYFMLGDNSRNSYDSRYWGFVPRANIYGRVSRIYYPFARASVPR
jgi:signal peptidase I